MLLCRAIFASYRVHHDDMWRTGAFHSPVFKPFHPKSSETETPKSLLKQVIARDPKWWRRTFDKQTISTRYLERKSGQYHLACNVHKHSGVPSSFNQHLTTSAKFLQTISIYLDMLRATTLACRYIVFSNVLLHPDCLSLIAYHQTGIHAVRGRGAVSEWSEWLNFFSTESFRDIVTVGCPKTIRYNRFISVKNKGEI